jgi:hypothetical protein
VYKARLRKEFGDVVVRGEEVGVTKAGDKTLTLTLTAPVDGVEQLSLVAFVTKSPMIYMIECRCPAAKRGEFEPQFHEIIDSFEQNPDFKPESAPAEVETKEATKSVRAADSSEASPKSALKKSDANSTPKKETGDDRPKTEAAMQKSAPPDANENNKSATTSETKKAESTKTTKQAEPKKTTKGKPNLDDL